MRTLTENETAALTAAGVTDDDISELAGLLASGAELHPLLLRLGNALAQQTTPRSVGALAVLASLVPPDAETPAEAARHVRPPLRQPPAQRPKPPGSASRRVLTAAGSVAGGRGRRRGPRADRDAGHRGGSAAAGSRRCLLRVEPGAMVALVGPSGAGKTPSLDPRKRSRPSRTTGCQSPSSSRRVSTTDAYRV